MLSVSIHSPQHSPNPLQKPQSLTRPPNQLRRMYYTPARAICAAAPVACAGCVAARTGASCARDVARVSRDRTSCCIRERCTNGVCQRECPGGEWPAGPRSTLQRAPVRGTPDAASRRRTGCRPPSCLGPLGAETSGKERVTRAVG